MKNAAKSSRAKLILAVGVGALGVALAAFGIQVGEVDDAPGAAVIGIALMVGALAVKLARRKIS